MRPVLADLIAEFGQRFAFAGVGLRQGNRLPEFFTASAPGLGPWNEHAFLRVASISKIVTAQVLLGRLGPRFDADISAYLGWPLRHPGHPGLPVTVGQVLSHSAGLSDAGGYLIPPDMPLAEWMDGHAVWGAAPGSAFAYSNLGYILLAEAAAGADFDDAAQAWMQSAGIEGGFNWSGVAARRNAIPCYRRTESGLEPRIDAVIAPQGVSAPTGLEVPRATIRHAGAFGPQGGLRTSLGQCLRLAGLIPGFDQTRLWRRTDGPTEGSPDVFQDYGAGLQFLDHPPGYPRPLVGHFASAYGFVGGVWHDVAADLSFAYMLNGMPEEDGEEDDFHTEERALFAALADLV
ncbi:MAG: beta-lactamase family protein [Roseicyclus sp.]|nr:beta-lactamase family protein [Roseicyclus sp.]MBO6624170.1 beta-lactamase family protein [Roseicyclus sp.]MBO6920832.1 beta-lactamase family protein [Roseicyclus sp.]